MDLTPEEMWEQRYGSEDYRYGTEPNEFLLEAAADLPVGDVLCLADGEGRNGVHLAELGHRVTSVDFSSAGMAKADRLAERRSVGLSTVVMDLGEFDLGENRWDAIVSIFAHTSPPVRARIHGSLARALRPGGVFILEAYTPDQIGRGTGGPRVPELTMDLERLRAEFVGMKIDHGVETVRNVLEGPGHTGEGAVVQVIATAVA